jgi:hypothetical protein
LASVGKGKSLLLHGGVDDHRAEVSRLGRPQPGRRREALLHQRHQPILAHAQAPARQRRAVEDQAVLEELLAAKQLVIGVFQPALAQAFIG